MPIKETFDESARQCQAFLKQEDWQNARRVAISLSIDFPNRPHGFVWRSIAELRLGNDTASNAIADLVFEAFPSSAWACENRARLAGFKKDWDLASKLWEECAELFPNSKGAYVEGARAHMHAGRNEHAQFLIEKGLRLAPTHVPYWSVGAELSMAQREWDSAALKWAEVRKHLPNNVAAYRKANEVLHRAGKHAEALQVMLAWIDRGKDLLPVDYSIATQSLIKGFGNLDPQSAFALHVFKTLILQPITPDAYTDSSEITKKLPTLSQSEPAKYAQIVHYIRQTFPSEIAEKGSPYRLLSLAIGLTEDSISEGEIEALVAKCHLDVFCRLFSYYPLHKSNVAALTAYLGQQDEASLRTKFSASSLQNLHLFATTEGLLDIPAIQNLHGSIDVPQQPVRALPSILGAKKLRIAVCVSGQFRGYKTAFKSWDAFRFSEHDTQFFVHGWYNTGQKFPTPANSARSFSGAFLAAYKESAYSYGIHHIQAEYPTLFDSYRASGRVSEQEIMDFYGTNNVVLEDDEVGDFTHFTSPMKMFYKIYKAWELAQKSQQDFDLLVRIRPDKNIGQALSLDWKHIYDICANKPVIFSDVSMHINYNINLFVGDQFAVSTPDLMAPYSEIYPNSLGKNGKIRTPSEYDRVHRKLAYTIYDAGLTAHKMPGVVFGHPLDAEKLGPTQIKKLLMCDVALRTPTKLDRQILAALQEDISQIETSA